MNENSNFWGLSGSVFAGTSGAAGGDLSGTYPNPTINATAPALGAATGTSLALTGGPLSLTAANGQSITRAVNRESLTLNTGATSTATSGNLAPANSKILAIVYRVTTTITTSVSYTIKVTGGNVFANIGTATTSQTGMTANTTGILVPVLHADQYNTTATTLTVTLNANPGAGVIELSVFYEAFVAPTS